MKTTLAVWLALLAAALVGDASPLALAGLLYPGSGSGIGTGLGA